MRYLLDTNIVSNVTKTQPSPSLLAWMADRTDAELYIPSLTIAEIRRGILKKAAGRKRRDLELWFEGPAGPSALFSGRVLSFDANAALVWADLMVEGGTPGRRRDPMDTIIAAIAGANASVIVTNNLRDFRGLDAIDPTAAR